MKKVKIVILFIALCIKAEAQKPYVLDLKPEKWDFKPSLFYIAGIIDERVEKRNAGQVLMSNKSVPAVFKDSIEIDLLNLVNRSIDQDSNTIPLYISIDRFKLTETGTTSNHKAKLDFAIKIHRIIEGKRYQLYEATGKPEISMRGAYANVHEKNIRETFKNVLRNFNKWINENPDQPLLAKSIVITVDTTRFISEETSDTIFWSQDYKLKWADFRGKKSNSSFMAQSNCVFTYKAEPKMKNGILELAVTLKACFEKSNSWLQHGQQNDTLLAHEQLHFDICELNIRKIRNRLLNTHFNQMEYDKEINPIFNSGWEEYQLQQQKYDEETEHGTILSKQLRWEKDISDQLRNTPEYNVPIR